MHIDQYVNEKRLKIANIRSYQKESRVLVSHSQLGKAEFNNLDFSHFKMVSFEQSNLVDCIFTNITWAKTVYGSSPSKGDKMSNRSFSSKSRETFRQLKYAMSKQGDVINEQKFHALEMGMYFETLTWRNDFWTKLIIFLSWLTSDFGQSFWRPLVFIFVFHSLFFLPLLFGFFSEFRISITEFSFPAFWKGLNTYLFLMNPLRKPDQEIFYGGWICIDVLMRISSSYMIYNMIRATRRFIK
ncbi:hypothetical protein SAMN05660909_05678 [Chitinophaga terrae (ex Kim and Jung 2007)]|uniref:Pentapeptide repeat-containing protein n=1 Tax=Chitinophaga terrae (ex Kim and Jung 2007) TaxID=408074 RepID=A0A1H4GSH9_9BACT|nr:hypothetical protein [Chitinophaga terrae (ex Kim and Jung 2007)]SEB12545.1 hypothetical protein SAMN05660909_05678 [Chitinophaga terrae (ex Kim and Jung 2007)]